MSETPAQTTTETTGAARDLRRLPKAHLHTHLEGSMRPSTLAELARGYGVPVPVVRGYGSFPVFADLYVAATRVLRTPQDLQRVVREVVEDGAADGAVWVEPQFFPPHHVPGLGTALEVVDVVLAEGRRTAERLGIGFGLMLSADRTLEPVEAERLVGLAAERADAGVVSFGLANDEALWAPQPFARAFAIASEAGLVSAPHAGELAGPESIRGALDTLAPRRLAHGVRAVEDPDLVRRLAEEGICLDVALTSNAMLSVVPSLEVHPLVQLLEAGVACSLNVDDSLLFGPGLLEEYDTARTVLGLDDDRLALIARSSVLAASHAPEELVRRALADIEAWVRS